MITVSLNEIRAQSPCVDGWRKALESKGGKAAELDAQFPITDILASNDLDDALWVLRCRPEHSNLWRKYAVWAARQVEHLMTDQRSRDALDVAWRHSEGLATGQELAAASAAALDAATAAASAAACNAALDAATAAALAAARAAARVPAWYAACNAARDAALDAARAAAWAAARVVQQKKLIEILTAGKWVE